MKKLLFIPVILLCCLVSYSQNYNVVLRSQLSFPGQTLANIWGYVDSLGNEYALCGAANGMSVVNVTDPDSVFQVKQVPFTNVYPANKKWKEIKVYKTYAYIVSEAGGGVQIVDLRHLPDTSNLPAKMYKGDGVVDSMVNRIHALHIDTTKGFLYLYGMTGLAAGGALVCDLSDPWNPVYVGQYNTNYIHDGYVDNDTLYSSHIYAGYFGVIDFTNKSNPVVLATANTPLGWTHNTWPSPDKKTLFTASETNGSFLCSYDISDLNNVTLLDTLHTADPLSIVHNVHVKNEFAVSSWYTEGFTIVDATRPWNLIEVGKYDTYSGAGSGFNGAWGVYPYLPSGTIVVSNIGEGLFVLTPNYLHACYLEGIVTDSLTQLGLNNVLVEILSLSAYDYSGSAGEYSSGTVNAGTYSVRFSKAGYLTEVINNVVLTNGVLTTLDVELVPEGIGIKAIEANTGYLKIAGANPFTSDCVIEYCVAGNENARLEVTDVRGRTIEIKLLDRSESILRLAGSYQPGIYYARIITDNGVSQPIKLLKVSAGKM